MDHFLYLSHLDFRIATLRQLLKLNADSLPPRPITVIEAMQEAGIKNAEDRVHIALEKAHHTKKYLERHPELQVVSRWCASFPTALKNIPYPPWVLFFKGQLPSAGYPSLAIIGTRRPNLYGREVLEAIVPHLQRSPLQIISGLAQGVDSIAHSLACSYELQNFAILANGLDHIYPRVHEGLAREISRNGGLISEFPPLTPARKEHFPWRNRIISGLSNAIWIVQGNKKSGTRHTGDHAAAQGRTICVTPGDIFSEHSEIAHYFLRNGATPIFDAQDLLMALSLAYRPVYERTI